MVITIEALAAHTYRSRTAWPRLLGLYLIALMAVASLCARPASCVPACPDGAEVVQPDGTRVTVFLRGDEHARWHEDANGYAIDKSPKTGAWVYAREINGVIAPTEHVVGKADPRALGLAKPNPSRILSTTSLAPNSIPVEQAPSLASTTGTMKNLVVLVNFSDLTIQYTPQQFDDLFNQIGYTTDGAVGSVKDYYLQISRNALTVESVIGGPVTLDNGYAYYGENFPPPPATGSDYRPREMVEQALAKLEASGFDFRTVDGNGDGWVDGLTIIHAGGGEEYSGNDTNYIWSHQWAVHSTITYDGVSMYTYHTEPARRGFDSTPLTQGITRIGVICHENGHFLGLPDLYDTNGGSKGIGDFCLMAGGSWNGSYGTSPAHMSAWCKADLGWVAPTTLSSGGSYAIDQVETSGPIYKLQGSFPSNEYFLVENRQGYGFDSALPGAQRGILIWHIDENQTTNQDPAHYKVDLEEASGTQHLELNTTNEGDTYDYFRSGNATMFTSTTTPNNYSYTGVPLGMNIISVSATGSAMSFVIDGGVVPTPTFSPDGGSFGSPQDVVVSCSKVGAAIYYTTDGSTPTESSASVPSGGTVLVDHSLTLKAKAFYPGWTPSSVKSSAYTITPTVATPVFNPDGAVYTSTQSVTITCATPSVTIRYTTNGSEPTSSSTRYNKAINISSNTTLKAKAFRSGYNPSATKTAVYAFVSQESSIAQAKAAPDGTNVGCKSVVVTAVFGTDILYAEEGDRSSGIRVYDPAHGLAVGDLIDAAGTMATTVDEERYINASATIKVAGQGLVAPVAVTSSGVVGGGYQYSPGPPISGQQGLPALQGLNNVGLLIRTWGRVTFRAGDGSYIYIDDGQAGLDASGHIGVRVILSEPGVQFTKNPQVSQFVSITGVAGLVKDGSALVRVVRPRSDADITIY